MLRDLVESLIPIEPNALLLNSWNQPIGQMSLEIWTYYLMAVWGPITGLAIPVMMLIPKTSPYRVSLPAFFIGSNEVMEQVILRILVTYMFVVNLDMGLSYLAPALGFFHAGALVGSVFYGAICAKTNRKIPLMLAFVLTTAVYITFMIWVAKATKQPLSIQERSGLSDGNAGSRKIRAFFDPNLVKALGGELGFDTAFSPEFQHCTLLLIMAGFAVSTSGVTQTILLDLWSAEVSSREALVMYGCFPWYYSPKMGCILGNLAYTLFDIHGTIIVILLHKVLAYVVLLISSDSKGWDRDVTVSGSPCYLKSMYYAMYLWPQGAVYITNMYTYMIYDRQHWNSSLAGQLSVRAEVNNALNFYNYLFCMRLWHLPTIGAMFIAIAAVPNPLYISLCMELLNFWRTLENFGGQFLFIMIWPAFIGQYLEIRYVPYFLGACEGLRNLGSFIAIDRWPMQLHCGDPMNCWRSQYMYSHAIFYNCGGDLGNQKFVCHYLFSKSQKRQCCCPYRKLKHDAPEKCCPPCCLGPFVEDTGGCPCPCCCSSCSA